MNMQLEERFAQCRPSGLTPPDVDRLRRRGRRRRAAKRTVAAVGSTAAVVAAVVLASTAPTPDVAITDPAATGGASPSDSGRGEQAQAGWEELTLDEAITRLADQVEASGGTPGLGDNEVREVVYRGLAGRGVSDENGTRSWLQPVGATVHVSADGTIVGVDGELGDPLDFGTSLADARELVSALPPLAVPDDASDYGDATRDAGALEQAEQLATKTEPWAPTDEATERPERAYALVRLADALRASVTRPGDLDTHERAFEVLSAVGSDWLLYRGTTTDLLGRDTIGIGALDPANDTETLFLFDPTTGWFVGTIELLHRTNVEQLRNDGSQVLLAEPDTERTLIGGGAITVSTFPRDGG